MWHTLDVGAVVDALAPTGAEVAAGAEGLGRQVRRAALATTADHLRRSSAGDLVVTTTAALLGTGEDPERLISHLDDAHVAGVAVQLGVTGRLPDEPLTAADRAALPVVTFPGTLEDVTGAVLDAQRRHLERILDAQQRLSRIALAGGGDAEVAQALHDLLAVPVAVVGPNGRATVVVPTGAPPPSADRSSARVPIRAPGSGGDEIVVGTGGSPLDAAGRAAMEQAAIVLGVRRAQAAAVAAAQERFSAVTLEELVSGQAGDVTDLSQRANAFGWDLSRSRAVLLASIDPPEDGAIPSTALGTIAAAARATLGRDAIVWSRATAIAALVAPDGDEPAERRRIAEGLREELDVRLRSVNVSIGVGRRVDTPAALARSFAEASRAVDVGRWAKGRHVTEVFDELGLERLLAATPTDDLVGFVQHAIGPLVAYDTANRAELVETLAVWLGTRNMAEAARRMNVHYNTLKNRLERIEAIVGPVLTDPARALECEVAIYVDRHYDVPWRGEPQGG